MPGEDHWNVGAWEKTSSFFKMLLVLTIKNVDVGAIDCSCFQFGNGGSETMLSGEEH